MASRSWYSQVADPVAQALINASSTAAGARASSDPLQGSTKACLLKRLVGAETERQRLRHLHNNNLARPLPRRTGTAAAAATGLLAFHSLLMTDTRIAPGGD